jgi:hypothetical protein
MALGRSPWEKIDHLWLSRLDATFQRLLPSAKEALSRRYASREVLLGPVEKAGDRSLERFDIVTLLFL